MVKTASKGQNGSGYPSELHIPHSRMQDHHWKQQCFLLDETDQRKITISYTACSFAYITLWEILCIVFLFFAHNDISTEMFLTTFIQLLEKEYGIFFISFRHMKTIHFSSSHPKYITSKKFMSRLNCESTLRSFHRKPVHSKKKQNSFSRKKKNGKNVAILKHSPTVETADIFFLHASETLFSKACPYMLPPLCTVISFCLEDFSLILLELFLPLESLQYYSSPKL